MAKRISFAAQGGQGPTLSGLSGDTFGTVDTPIDGVDLESLLNRIESGALDSVVGALDTRSRHQKWQHLPERIILIRHGESEGNVNRNIYSFKGDALLELTPNGISQAKEAGKRLKSLVGQDDIFVVASPWERVQQTLLGLYKDLEGLDEDMVKMVHVSPQIREQEFGNFQSVGGSEMARAEQALVGRFYYRRSNAESSADVYDRVSAFWDELIHYHFPRQTQKFGTCLMVTHGLTIRLILMKIFQWSVETFETVWNLGNCHHITLRKDMEKMDYVLCTEESFPSQIPWATRNMWVVKKSKKASFETEEKLRLLKLFKQEQQEQNLKLLSFRQQQQADQDNCGDVDLPGDWLEIDRAIDETQNKQMMERSEKYHVLDYLTLPQPRTSQWEALKGRLCRGHGMTKSTQSASIDNALDWDDVEFIDWWGTMMSYQGKMLRQSSKAGQPKLQAIRRMSSDFTLVQNARAAEEPSGGLQAVS